MSDSPSNPRRSAYIPETLRHFLLEEANGSCAMCRKRVGVHDIHHMTARARGGLTTYPNLIVLCPNCHRLSHKCRVPARALKRLKASWAQYCKQYDNAHDRLRTDADDTLNEARRLSVCPRLDDVRRAEAMLEVLVSRIDPLNVEAALLLEKVSAAAQQMRRPDIVAYSLGSKFVLPFAALCWLGITVYTFFVQPLLALVLLLATPLGLAALVLLNFLTAVLPHELGHAVGMYVGFSRRVPGSRVSFWRALRHIDWSITDLFSLEGLRRAFRGDFKGVSINLTRLQEEWWAQCVGEDDLKDLQRAVVSQRQETQAGPSLPRGGVDV